MSNFVSTLPIGRLKEVFREQLERVDGSIRLVCFDFFDTLVGRTVLPEETKLLAAKRLAETLPTPISGELLYQLRSHLEERLCRENRERDFDLEFTLPDLGQALHATLAMIVGEPLLPPVATFIDRMAGIELAVEKDVQVVREDVVELMHYAHGKGVSIAIVSDFYLPGQLFAQLVRHHHLSAMVDKVIVSADFLVTKGHSGRLYDKVTEAFGCTPKEMIMVGDNPHADVVMATQKGILAYCLEKAINTDIEAFPGTPVRDREQRVFSEIFAGFCNKPICFPEMGLSLFYFTHLLFNQAVKDRKEILFFCSKEGEFLRRLFQRYQELRFGQQVIESRYLLVSRKATYICSCQAIDQEGFERLFTLYRDQSLSEFLQSLNFSAREAHALCESLGLSPFPRHENLLGRGEFQTLIGSTLFRERYEAHRSLQKQNFLRYLEHQGVDFAKGHAALVDVGWKGSIQNNIYHTLGGQVRVSGYYLGLLSPTEHFENNEKLGILFSDVPIHSPYIHVFNNNRSLFEMVLGASHGSADGYFSGEQWQALEFPRQSNFWEGAQEHHPYATVLDLPEERELFSRYIEPLQQSYLHLFEQLVSAMGRLDGPPEIGWFARHHARMLFRPSQVEVNFFAGLYHLENYGVFEFTTFAGEGQIPLKQRWDNLIKLWRNPTAILETGVWQPIIFRRMGLSWLQPLDGYKRYRRLFGG